MGQSEYWQYDTINATLILALKGNDLGRLALTIRFDQLEDNRVNWYVEPDDKVWETRSLSLIELAESGAPLSALAIRALWKLCIDGLDGRPSTQL